MIITALAIVALISLNTLGAAAATFPAGSGITELTPQSFDQNVMNSNATHAVLFYAPWCGYCKQFAPEYVKAAKRLRGLVGASAVNCDEHKSLCGAEGIQGFPVLKIYYTNIRSGRRVPAEYSGERVAKPVVDFATSRIPNYVKPIAKMGLEKFYALANDTLPKAIVIKPPSRGSKPTSSLLKALAIEYRYRMIFGEVSAPQEHQVYQHFSPPSKQNSLLIITVEGEVVSYAGEMKQVPLRKFFNEHSLNSDSKGSKKTQETSHDDL